MNVPKFTIDGNENRIITFEFKGVAKDANRLRIIFMNKIPVMAIDKITIIQNSCLLDDQLLCNRVALIPITNNDSEGIIPSEMIIDEKCEGDELIVLSSDIRDGDPTYKNIPIATLIKGQSLNIRMTNSKRDLIAKHIGSRIEAISLKLIRLSCFKIIRARKNVKTHPIN